MPSPGATESLIAASLSDVGRTRKENQDACGEFRNSLGERLLITADGMGGHTGGATASRLCIESVGREFASPEGTAEERLRRGFEAANTAVHGYAVENTELTGMGTTGVAFLFTDDLECWLGWVGDSRAYRFRDGQLVALSDDHSVVGEWVRNGVISEEEAEVHPRRNELMRAIGPEPEVQIDTKQVEILPGDRFLLCSDGLCGYLRGPEIAAIVGFEQPEAAVRKLVDKVNEEHNSPDNVTVQIIEVPQGYGGGSAPGEIVSASGENGDGLDRSSAAVTKEIDTTTMNGTESDDEDDIEPEEEDWEPTVYEEKNQVPLIVGTAIVVFILLSISGYYACTIGGGGVPLRNPDGAEPTQQSEVGLEEPAEATSDGLAQNVALRTAERRQRIEEERLAQAESRAERERQRAEAEQLATDPVAAAGVDPPAVSIAPPIEPEASTGAESFSSVAGPVLDLAIQAFLEDWALAAQSGNYGQYSSLGMQETRVEFMRRYGAYRELHVQFGGISHRLWADGRLIVVEAMENVTYSDEVGTHSSQIPRSFVLRQTPDGLRYVDSRD